MSMKISRKIDSRFIREFSRAAIRSTFASILASVVTAKKRDGKFTYSGMAAELGVDKSVISRWFNRDVNWEINSLADIAEVLDIDFNITATDRKTGKLYGPAGPTPVSVETSTSRGNFDHTFPIATPGSSSASISVLAA